MPLPLILLLVLGTTALLSMGCDVEEDCETKEDSYGYKESTVNDDVYTDGRNTVVLDKRIDPAYADYFLSQISNSEEELRDDLGLESPWDLDYFVVGSDNHPEICPKPCTSDYAAIGQAYRCLNSNEIEGINESIESGGLVMTDGIENLTILHESSHALRSSVANFRWSSPEEGLARYSEHRYSRLRKSSPNMSDTIFSGVVDDGLPTSIDPDRPDETLRFLYKDGPSYVFRYHLPDCYDSAPVNVCLEELIIGAGACVVAGDVIVCAHGDADDGAFVKTHDLEGLQGEFITCLDDGYVKGARYSTEDGEVIIEDTDKRLYHDMLETGLDLYNLGSCFWDRMGHDAVRGVIASMIEFSKDNQSEEGDFPLFQTVMELTGMDEGETFELFETHDVPIDDYRHPLGNACWE